MREREGRDTDSEEAASAIVKEVLEPTIVEGQELLGQ
jgi:hypothetical protein